MNHLNYVTRGGSNPQGKPKVFFSAHPGDTDCLGEVEKLILDRQDCVFFWLESDPGKEEEREHLFNLSLMQLLVVPVTTKLLTSRNRAKDTDIPFALAHHIPVLPLMYEPGLEQLFNKTIGNIQFLVVHDTDVTAISFGRVPSGRCSPSSAASIMVRVPAACRLTMSAPRPESTRMAFLTVFGMSCSFRSRNTPCPRSFRLRTICGPSA